MISIMKKISILLFSVVALILSSCAEKKQILYVYLFHIVDLLLFTKLDKSCTLIKLFKLFVKDISHY